ncbi:MAG: hypothetical protein HY000_18845 [Planctomycetes bacterium]|nr:hypothetical protein [Planctomycetota bacterium]
MLAWRDGQPVGRIMVSDDPRYHAIHSDNVGCFGMFESIDEPAVAHALLNAAAQWLTARGRTAIRGPIDYSMSYPVGLLIEGFDTPPRVMMNHHPAYYAALLESCGLTKAKDLYAWWFVDSDQMLDKWRRREERFRAKSGITIRPFNKRNFDADVQACMGVYRDAWEKNWGFVPMSDAECEQFAGHLRTLAAPELILLAEHHGKAIGIALTLPDFNEALRPLNGRLTTWGLPIGLVRFLYRIKRVKTGRLVALGVLEPYRRRGVCESLILHTLEAGKHRFGLTGAELSWTLEDAEGIPAGVTASCHNSSKLRRRSREVRLQCERRIATLALRSVGSRNCGKEQEASMICPIDFVGESGGVFYYSGMDCDTSEWWPMSSHTPLELGCPGDPQNCWFSSALASTPPADQILMHGLGKTGLKNVLSRTEGFPSQPGVEVMDSVDCEFKAADGSTRRCRLFLVKSFARGIPRYLRIGMEVESDPKAPRPQVAEDAQPIEPCAYRVTYSRMPFVVLVKGN